MKGSDFTYYAARCKKHRMMAEISTSKKAAAAHRRLANAYADRAALAMMLDDGL